MTALQITEQMCDEVENIREAYVKLKVARRINRREGAASTAEVSQWEREFQIQWNAGYPALARLLEDGTETPRSDS